MRFFILLCFALVTTGCSGMFDFMIPSHPKSRATSPDLVCVKFSKSLRESGFVAVAAPIIAGIVVDQIAKGLEAESKRYSATYSGRASNYLLTVSQEAADKEVEITLNASEISLDRYHGEAAKKKTCPENIAQGDESLLTALEKERIVTFVAKLELSDQKDVLSINLEKFEIKKTKAKVSYFDSEVDINVQVTLTTFVKGKDGEIKALDIAQVDFPIGKVELGKDVFKSESLDHLKSGFIPIPQFNLGDKRLGLPSEEGKKIWPVNVTVKIMEADDFGDVIGKGAKTVREKRAQIIESMLGALGVKRENK